MELQKRNAWLLGLCQFCFLAASAVGLAFSGLAGAWLAPDKSLATLPFLAITVVTAAATLVVPRLIQRLGVRTTLSLGSTMAALGAWLSVWALTQHHFVLFCLGNACMGLYQACAQYYRYIAADNATPDFRASAIAYVLSGGILAALCGPWLAAQSQNWWGLALFGGSFALAGLLAFASLPLIAALRLRPVSHEASVQPPPRPLRQILAGEEIRLGMVACVGGYAVMSFVMTASPFAVVSCGYSNAAAAGVIQWHLLGMYGPSLLSGRLVERLGARRVVTVGVGLGLAALAVAALGQTLRYFQLALALVGIGWNLMYVGGTALLMRSYRPSEKDTVQACNEFATFGAVAVAIALAGVVQNRLGWEAILWFALLPLGIAASALAWNGRRVWQRA
ncbi:MFS transporter [Chitinimonas lacunae]|uniref:MFS transporter n=1 Tax=Chitinimonas lacunae TaxID=1963018 RepID=A0ABV8MSP9_9NEIS